jgi:hypothetical protein
MKLNVNLENSFEENEYLRFINKQHQAIPQNTYRTLTQIKNRQATQSARSTSLKKQ